MIWLKGWKKERFIVQTNDFGFMKHSPQSVVLLKKNTIIISLEPHKKEKILPLSGNKLLLTIR